MEIAINPAGWFLIGLVALFAVTLTVMERQRKKRIQKILSEHPLFKNGDSNG